MGRELKRVPLDFAWPLNQRWDGFLNPLYTAKECPNCAGSGYSQMARKFSDQWYGKTYFDPSETGSVPFLPEDPFIQAFAERNVGALTPAQQIVFYGFVQGLNGLILMEADRLCRLFNGAWMHHLDQEDVNALWTAGRLYDFNPNWAENHNEGVPPPPASEVNRWSLRGFGHDSVNNWICVKAKCERLGFGDGECERCHGEGALWPSKKAKAAYEAWERIEPPTGEGYQVWETVTEGSPISPVFPDTEALERWLIGEGYSEGAAETFAKEGFAVSLTMVNGTVYNNIEGLNAATGEE